MIWILTEVSPSGLVASNHVIHTMHIYDIGGSHSAVTITCQLLLVAYIIYFVLYYHSETQRKYFSVYQLSVSTTLAHIKANENGSRAKVLDLQNFLKFYPKFSLKVH